MFLGIKYKFELAVLMLTVFGLPAAMANTLQEINYSALPGGKMQISLVTSEPVGETNSFATDNPARIAIDLPNTTSALENKTKRLMNGLQSAADEAGISGYLRFNGE